MVEIKNVLFPCDFTENSAKVFPYVQEVSEKWGCSVVLFHVVEGLSKWAFGYVPHLSLDTFQNEAAEGAQRAMEGFCEKHLQGCPSFQRKIVSGDPVEEILKVIDSDAIDLVVMGTHGRKGLEHTIFGSVAGNVVRRAPVPVLVVNPNRLR